jgi:hypothetical protein
MHSQNRLAVTADTTSNNPSRHPSSDMAGQLIDEKSANQFRCELGEEIQHDPSKDGAGLVN